MKKNILYIHTHDSGRFLEPFGVNVKTPNIMRLRRKALCSVRLTAQRPPVLPAV